MKRGIVILISVILTVLILTMATVFYRSTWRRSALTVAVVGFFDSDNMIWTQGASGTPYEVRILSAAEITPKKLRGADVLLWRTIGQQPNADVIRTLDDFGKRGTVIPYPLENDTARRFSTLSDAEVATLAPYLANLSVTNAQSALKLLSQRDRSVKQDVPPPVLLPTLGYFYHGDSVSPTLDDFLKRSDLPKLAADAPRIALFGPFLNPSKWADHRPVDELITKLEIHGWRVFPIFGSRSDPKLPELLEACRPDLAIVFPLGRTFSGQKASKDFAETDDADFFSRLDVPVLSAISLSVSEETWRNEPIGMTGSYQNLGIALPELDGVIEPTPFSTMEKNETGKTFRAPLSERIDRLVDRCDRWRVLRTKANRDKRIAVFYYKGPGESAMTAQSLDVLPSLYNTLLSLKKEGYDLGGDFPESFEVFQQRMEAEGRNIGQWGVGAMEEFVQNGKPDLIPTSVYRDWFEKSLSEKNRWAVVDLWGLPPGRYGTIRQNRDPDTVQKDASNGEGNREKNDKDETFLTVSRVRFGNIVLLPQPTTDIISDDREGHHFKSVHGTNKAPPHFYLGAYFWIREKFQADAVIHFGTHGSLEFTKGKSAVLSDECWPDILIDDLPHLYLYSVNNVGEALLAKRRTRAVLISHLTPPFTSSGLYGDWAAIGDKLDSLRSTEEPAARQEIIETINERVAQSGLSLPESIGGVLTDDEGKIETWRHELNRLQNASVTEGLHVIGRPWTESQVKRTAAAISETAEENQRHLTASFDLETDRLITALSARFIPPSTGGDPIVNPDSIPTGRNIAGLNMERTPSAETCRAADHLVAEMINRFRAENGGAFPRRVAVTLWGGEYLRTKGLSVAQAFSLLGVRPVFDSKGTLRDIAVIPSEELGRPRIDIVVQTSGQFRDAAGSRIELLDKAVRTISELENERYENYVRQDTLETVQTLRKSGWTKEEAKALSTARIFGATHALNYGTGIMRLVERGDRWEKTGEIADQYLLNMGGVYRSGKVWGVPIEGLLESNLAGTDLFLQTRSSNVWGPVKLDHLYEFNTLSLVVREKTGRDPKTILTDVRRGEKVAENRTLHDAVREELVTTLWNPKWLAALQKEGKSGTAVFPEMTRNLFGLDVVGESDLVDAKIWDETYRVLIEDVHGLGFHDYFTKKNPSALQDVTAIMLETIRKGFWTPTEEIRKRLAEIHTESVIQSGAGGTYETCGNPKLHAFLGELLPQERFDTYRAELNRTLNSSEPNPTIEGMTLKEKSESDSESAKISPETSQKIKALKEDRRGTMIILFASLLIILAGGIFNKRE